MDNTTNSSQGYCMPEEWRSEDNCWCRRLKSTGLTHNCKQLASFALCILRAGKPQHTTRTCKRARWSYNPVRLCRRRWVATCSWVRAKCDWNIATFEPRATICSFALRSKSRSPTLQRKHVTQVNSDVITTRDKCMSMARAYVCRGRGRIFRRGRETGSPWERGSKFWSSVFECGRCRWYDDRARRSNSSSCWGRSTSKTLSE